MENFGTLIDKLTIMTIREGNLLNLIVFEPTEEYKSALVDVKKKNEVLKEEINTYLALVLNGTIKLDPSPQHKLYYDKKDDIKDTQDFASNIVGLFSANRKLWELEDKRRDRTLSDEDRLICADEVSAYNQIRNQHSDKLNKLLSEAVNKVV